MDAFEPVIEEILKSDRQVHRKQRHTARRIFERLRDEHGYVGGERAATLMTLTSTALRNDLDVWAYLKDALDQLLAGSTDYEALRADVWKLSHPEFVRTYRSDERRDTANRTRLTRAQRRLANAKKLEAQKLHAQNQKLQ